MSAVKKGVKKIGRFVKKHWKKIAVAAAVVFTAGLATVGTAGFGLAAQSAGGGIGGFLSAAGSTLKAGVAAIGGTLGIGSGVTTTTAGGAFASAPAVQGALAAGKTGATLMSGAAAQALGFAPSAAQGAAQFGQAASTGAGTVAGDAFMPALTAGGGSGMASPAAMMAGPPAVGAAPAASLMAASQAPGFLQSPLAQTLVMGGIGALSARMSEKERDKDRPRGFFGVDLQGNNHLTPSQMWGAGWRTGPSTSAWANPYRRDDDGG